MTNAPLQMIEGYGRLARQGVDATSLAGRYRLQAEAERRILSDLRGKLALEPHHRLLEIGCGPGSLLIPLAFEVAEAWGIDHADVLDHARRRAADSRLHWLSGRFPDVRPDGRFDRIYAYSVVQCLPSMETVHGFLDAAIELLTPGGRLLIADIPNADRRARFQSSAAGQAFEVEWAKLAATPEAESDRNRLKATFAGVAQIGSLDDAHILALAARYRQAGCHTYLLPQDPRLPFGNTREDLMIVVP